MVNITKVVTIIYDKYDVVNEWTVIFVYIMQMTKFVKTPVFIRYLLDDCQIHTSTGHQIRVANNLTQLYMYSYCISHPPVNSEIFTNILTVAVIDRE